MLAHVDRKGGPRVGRYGVDVASFERIGVHALREALRREGCVFVDEIGKMELCSNAFRQAAEEVMDSDHPVIATIPQFSHPFLDSLRQRKDATFVAVSAANRDDLPDRLIALLNPSRPR